jgi:hypothetical protein
MKTAFCIVIFLFATSLYAQNRSQIRYVDSSFYASKTDSLEHLFGFNKKIPTTYKLAVLYTLSHFPELDSTKIIFKEKKIKTTLNARPVIVSLLFRKNKTEVTLFESTILKKTKLLLLMKFRLMQ